MVKVREDLTGKVFEHLTVIEQTEDYVDSKGCHYAQWLCECDCLDHNKIIVRGSNLKSKNTTSCGCVHTGILKDIGYNNKTINKYDLSGEFGIGWTNNTNAEFYFDLEDYEKIKDYCWIEHTRDDGYKTLEARELHKQKIIRMHYIIFDKFCDHKDRNTFNNRKSNLREATPSQQSMNKNKRKDNSSGFIGVNWHKAQQMWVARINIDKKRKTIGYFNKKEDAIIARLKAEKEYYGEFSPQKHLFEEWGI